MTEPQTVQIPGSFYARLDEEGNVASYMFMPAEGDPGYFGWTSQDVETGEAVDPNTDGPFWTAIAHSISKGEITVPVEWEG